MQTRDRRCPPILKAVCRSESRRNRNYNHAGQHLKKNAENVSENGLKEAQPPAKPGFAREKLLLANQPSETTFATKIHAVRTYFTAFAFLAATLCGAQDNTTPTYAEVIAAYEDIARSHPETARLKEVGTTDAGVPLHLLIIDGRGKFDPEQSRHNGDLVWLIMNGIHPGESCGIDASLRFAEKAAENPDKGLVYAIIPVYNVGGALNRNRTSRANQNGPEEYGFRGNDNNYDLNRDFIKADTRNTFAFAEIFHTWQPHFFIDTHTSNGADYGPNMTLIHTVPERLHPMQRTVFTREILPEIFRRCEAAGEPLLPYVNTRGGVPESGIYAFNDLPRYSTGYAALFGTAGITSEAHMLKPYPDRVQAMLTLLETTASVLSERRDNITALKKAADSATASAKEFPTAFRLTAEASSVEFSGYRADTLVSKVTGLSRLRYNRNKPFTEKVPYYRTFAPERSYTLPVAFIIPQSQTEVITRLEANGIALERLEKDEVREVTAHYIESYETAESPYEGHYLHRNTTAVKRRVTVRFRAGDVVVTCNQKGNRYLAHVFDPESPDSFFNWNFFDAFLMRKEYFSAYLFEDTAAEILKRNTMLAKKFEEKKRADADFASDSRAQLDFIYKNSKYSEPEYMRLPIFETDAF